MVCKNNINIMPTMVTIEDVCWRISSEKYIYLVLTVPHDTSCNILHILSLYCSVLSNIFESKLFLAVS